jgi:tRNA (cmo5U34)-methyltransferase
VRTPDNATAHSAADYEREVRRTIPMHAEILEQAVDSALAARPSAARWLDTGCGPGRLAAIARARCSAKITLADPSPAMLALARARHADLPDDRFLQVSSQELPPGAPFDVVTAVQCHHYGDEAARARAVARCYERLAPGGAFVTFENVRAETEAGHALQRQRWSAWLARQGRDPQAVRAQMDREGNQFFPVRVSEHQRLLATTGFDVVELIWRSYGQAGFLCLKGQV